MLHECLYTTWCYVLRTSSLFFYFFVTATKGASFSLHSICGRNLRVGHDRIVRSPGYTAVQLSQNDIFCWRSAVVHPHLTATSTNPGLRQYSIQCSTVQKVQCSNAAVSYSIWSTVQHNTEHYSTVQQYSSIVAQYSTLVQYGVIPKQNEGVLVCHTRGYISTVVRQTWTVVLLGCDSLQY